MYDSDVGYVYGGGAGVFGFPSLCLRGVFGQMVGAACQDGLSGTVFPLGGFGWLSLTDNIVGDHDVLASSPDSRLDGEGY